MLILSKKENKISDIINKINMIKSEGRNLVSGGKKSCKILSNKMRNKLAHISLSLAAAILLAGCINLDPQADPTRFTFYYYFLQDFKGLEFSFISLYSSIQLILLIMS